MSHRAGGVAKRISWIGRLSVALAVAAVGAEAARAFETWQIAVDYDKLSALLGNNVPSGQGVPIAQIEAGNNGVYFPDVNSPEFAAAGDPLGTAVQFIDGSGGMGSGTSSHATLQVGRYFYGNTFGVARAANQVTIYEANGWLQNVLGANSSSDPVAQDFRVQNSSWIGTFNPNNPSADVPALQRYDYLIDKYEITAVVGIDNNDGLTPNFIPSASKPHQRLFSSAMNTIAVGRSDGRHSRGMTSAVYYGGRYKPDLVAPSGATSASTSMVSSAATLLHQTVAGTDAGRSETMKAILMAGATKQEFAAFVDPATGLANPWDHTTTRPLDDLFGAGELNVLNSYKIQLGGRHAGTQGIPIASAESYGWDYQDRKNDSTAGDVYYNFVIPAGSTASELSVMLAWNLKVTDSNPSAGVFSPSDSLQDLNLTLYDSTSTFLGAMIDQSVSAVDNVEHIYRTNLGPGVYTLAVSGSANWDYGLAWRTTTQFDQLSADFNGDGEVDGADLTAWQSNLGKLVNATHAQGDADGDGDVDSADLAVFNSQVVVTVEQPLPEMASSRLRGAISAIPEPGTLALVAGLLATAGLQRAFAERRRARGESRRPR